MKVAFKNNRDAYAGLIFIGIGATALYLASSYRFGSSTAMGPGYFPAMLGGVLMVLGLLVLAKGLRTGEKITVGWSPRAVVMLTVSVILFAVLMPVAGFVPAIAALVFGSAASSSEFRLTEVAALTIVLTVATAAIIIFALGMPYPLFGHY